MLKNYILPIQYNSFLNITCGEIICQSETSFIIICKLCEIKIFQFNEFVKHFRLTHWPEIKEASIICNSELDNNDVNVGGGQEENIKTESCAENDEMVYEEYALDESENLNEIKIEKNRCQSDEVNDKNYNSLNNDKEDSINIFESLAILRKRLKSSNEREGSRYKNYIQKHKDLKFKCDKCNRSFAKELQLVQHQYSHTGYPCKKCGKSFKQNASLSYHIATHVAEKKFICDFENCAKAFINKRRLDVHKRMHFPDTVFVCEVCGSRQRNKNSLKDHIRTHTGEKPFACSLCDHRFTSRSLLNEHKACHETERRHVCDVCGKSFNRQKALYHHKHLHLDIKKFVCKICGLAYAQAAGLSAHMRKHKKNG